MLQDVFKIRLFSFILIHDLKLNVLQIIVLRIYVFYEIFQRNTASVLHLDLNLKNFLKITFHHDKIVSTVFVAMV